MNSGVWPIIAAPEHHFRETIGFRRIAYQMAQQLLRSQWFQRIEGYHLRVPALHLFHLATG
jgi:hypothetical protein